MGELIILEPWRQAHYPFGDAVFVRLSSSDIRESIIIMKDNNNWYIEKPFIGELRNIVPDGTNTPESLMFKIDLFLLDNIKYDTKELFVFPDNDL